MTQVGHPLRLYRVLFEVSKKNLYNIGDVRSGNGNVWIFSTE